MSLSPQEAQALADTEAFFRSPEEGLLGRVSRSLFKPVEILTERLIPDKLLEVAGNGVAGVLRGIATLTDQTLSPERVLRAARKHQEVDTLEDLRCAPLEVLDEVSREVLSEHQTIAALEGAGCGVGGLALLAADIPLLLGVTLRSVRQVGMAYGVDPKAAGEGVIAFKIFELACGGTRDRYARLLELDTLLDELDGLEPQRRAEKAAVLASLIVTREAVKRIVSLLLGRKLLQAIPVAGAVVGAGFNYLFVQDVGETARQIYRRRWLLAKQL
ncbi:MAG: EcsC family protein [Planctomycetes bacterium]|nr:EcsC family protein [Planctomycetota bacterium]